MKKCSKCKVEKTLAEFTRDMARYDGLRYYCKTCARTYRETSKKQRTQKNYEWKLANPDKVREYSKRYQAKHKDILREKQLNRQHANPKLYNERVQKWRQNNKENIVIYRRKNRHKDRAYYSANKGKIKARREALCGWRVYQITFTDGVYYIGSATRPDLRFNSHKSNAARGKNSRALNGRNFTTAKLTIIRECATENEMLKNEADEIRSAIKQNNGCLNTRPPTGWRGVFWVYVIQGQERIDKCGRIRPGLYYVGMTSDPARRLRQHNGELTRGARATKSGRPWAPRALYGPYETKSEALRAEYALKRYKRGINRTMWLIEDSTYCRGSGANHQWITNPLWKLPDRKKTDMNETQV